MDSNTKNLKNKLDENYENIEDNGNNEDFEDDVYLIELHKRLTNMKKDRKKAEQDASLLDNRLKLLKGEEEKVKFIFINFQTWKKIEVTKKKTHDKIVNLQKQEETLRSKLEVNNF